VVGKILFPFPKEVREYKLKSHNPPFQRDFPASNLDYLARSHGQLTLALSPQGERGLMSWLKHVMNLFKDKPLKRTGSFGLLRNHHP
jgi:hypothetical protein